jgi:hypothetical protein
VQEKPTDWVSQDLFRQRNDFLRQDMAPSARGNLCGTVATTNRWGMRDREYDKEKPSGVYRFVLLGSSHEVGSGVKDDETFENLVEDALNRASPGSEPRKYEILNLSVGGYGVLRKLVKLEGDGFGFEPDAILFSVNAGDRVFDLGDMTKAMQSNLEMPYGFLDGVITQARADGRMADLVIRHRLQPHVPEVFTSAFERLGDSCRERGIRAFVVYRPATIDPAQIEPARHAEVIRLAKDAGLEVLDLSSSFNQVADRSTLTLAPWDDHTNALGHRLLADRLYAELTRALANVQTANAAQQSDWPATTSTGQAAKSESGQ